VTTPAFLTNKQADTDFFELYTIGRYITVRPEITSSGSSTTVFDALATTSISRPSSRLRRFATIRPTPFVRPTLWWLPMRPPLSTGTV